MSSTFRGRQTFEVREADVNLELVRAVTSDPTRYEIFVENGRLKFRKKGSVNVLQIDDGTIIGGGFVDRPYLAALTSGDSAAITGTGLQTFNKSHQLPAGLLNVAGAVLYARAAGIHSTDASPGLVTLGIRLGGQFVVLRGTNAALSTSVTDQGWSIEGNCAVRATGSAGTVVRGGGSIGFVNQSVVGCDGGTVTLNLTAALTVDVQINPSDSGNSFTMQSLIILVYPIVATTF